MSTTPILLWDITPVRANRYARNTDPIASHIAAKNARGGKDCQQRLKIVEAVESCPGGLNYKEIACVAGLEPIAVARRIFKSMRQIERLKNGANTVIIVCCIKYEEEEDSNVFLTGVTK